jgi:S1-C subfamily serine protease
VLLVTAALLGGGVTAGLLAAAGALGGGGTATTASAATPDTAARSTVPVAATGGSAGSALDARALYSRASPAVVDITARTSSAPGVFGRSQGTATGTGFVVDGDGHVLTAAHVVDNASSITLTFHDGATRKATLLGKDDATDVAVLKVDPSGLKLHPLTLGSSAAMQVGDAVAAIGDPFGYDRSLSTGVVSGLDRTIQAPNGFTVAHAIQTDAALNPGNSGGPLLNARGEVIGIADQIATNGAAESSTGVGFAVPIDLVRSELSNLQAGKSVGHAYLGVSTANTGTRTAGALINQVAAGGPAASAGLRSGDIVTVVGSTQVRDANDLVAAIASHRPGDQVKLTVKRGSGTRTVTVTLGTQPKRAAAG